MKQIFNQMRFPIIMLSIVLACAALFGLYKLSSWAYTRWDAWLDQKIVDQAAQDVLLVITPNSVIDTWQEPERMNAFCRKVQLMNLRTKILTELEAALSSTPLTPAHQAALQHYIKTAQLFFGAIDTALNEDELQKIAANISNVAGYLGASSSRVSKIKAWLGSFFGYGQKIIEQYAHKNPCADKPEGNLSLVDHIVANKMVYSSILQNKPDTECTQAELREKQKMHVIKEAIAHNIQNRLGNQGKAAIVKHLLPYVLLFVSVVHA